MFISALNGKRFITFCNGKRKWARALLFQSVLSCLVPNERDPGDLRAAHHAPESSKVEALKRYHLQKVQKTDEGDKGQLEKAFPIR